MHAKPAGEGPAIELAGERVAIGPDGVDEVEVLLRPHPGAPPLPVQRGASGGELSRVMLAIEVVFAGSDPVPTMVFDEVDAGVGGRAAVEVGRRLARLAADHQVLVVTHLPQVAAYADAHVMVDKTDSDGDPGHPQRRAGARRRRPGAGAGPDAGRSGRLRAGPGARGGAAGHGRGRPSTLIYRSGCFAPLPARSRMAP